MLPLALTAALLLGCSEATAEPGLFGRPPVASDRPPPRLDHSPRPPTTNPRLPVLAEEVWSSGDGLGVQVRIAVHAVRRISGATVLDWSITPLKAPDLWVGDAVPPAVDLGLSRSGDELPRIHLLDGTSDDLYRPLVNASGWPRCVCTPLPQAQRRLRIGHTSLLQVAFPQLPPTRSTIDVVIATLPPFGRVPISRADHIPVTASPGVLGRSGQATPIPGVFSRMFRYGPGQQIFQIQPNRVLASHSFTALEWTIWSVTGGDGLDSAASPPFTEPAATGAEVTDPVVASGPVLVVAAEPEDRVFRTRLVQRHSGSSSVRECLCSPLQGWTAQLRRPDKPVTVVTTYAPLPAGTIRAEVRWEGVGTFLLPVMAAADARDRIAREIPWSQTTWRARDPHRGTGWAADEWPTPVPAADQLPDSGPRPDTLVR